MDRDELLLLADGAEEAERVRSEADQPNRRQREQAQPGARRHRDALAAVLGGEHEERQHDAGRDLDADPRDQHAGAGAQARAGPGGERERSGEQEQDQRVVVRPPDRELEQHRVQAHEGRRPAGGMAEDRGGPRDQRHRAEARADRDRLERPQPAGETQRGRRVAGEREERAVGGVLEGPADEREDRIARGFGRHMRVGVEAVQGAHAGEAEVAEHVLGEQGRPEQEDQVGQHDRREERAHSERPRGEQHEQVARAHDQRKRLEAARRDAEAQALERTSQPTRPAAAARGHVGG